MTPIATAEAFRELRAVAGDGALDRLSFPSSEASDETFVAALNAADDKLSRGNGDFARAVGIARADAIVGPRAGDFEGDALRFLREGSALMFAGRANYGASSVELVPRKALLRIVAPEHLVRRVGDAPNRMPILAAAFLERAVELITGERHVPRYLGHAPRIDTRFGCPMVNLLFEFDLVE